MQSCGEAVRNKVFSLLFESQQSGLWEGQMAMWNRFQESLR